MIALICTVLFCLGWRIVTDEGQLLYFIKKPFEDNYNRINALTELGKKTPISRTVIYYIGKPFVMCITCMASIWGTIIFWTINAIAPSLIGDFLSISENHFSLMLLWVWNCIAASFIQTLIWKLYAKLD